MTELNGGKALAHWTLHDLRRTFSSGCARLRIPTEIDREGAQPLSAPISAALPRVYNLHEYETERAEAMEAWAHYVMAVVDGKPPQNVVPLRPVA